ncbi:MAG: Isoleucine--tRNA ligase [Alphaproteobacteria bacterium MarineAlpha9_Bin4]|nr:isoleucine--tRNA ligase [Pelagibacterales bacterium]PPR25629.1 MAG: Isoleucine--tRNA ligase [Alphaproteobacteria bacterium MarineAlpha9_Bin4]
MKDTKRYNDTLLLPKTNFEMRANLPEKEIRTLKFWEDIGLWKALREAAKGREKFILHDGPPYANGPIHMGTAANKILKDIINRTMQMEGFDAEFIPGWDCHGLPIEWQIEKEYRKKGLNKDEVDIKAFRDECRDFAAKWIEEQKKSFIRLFVLADWGKPYLTMNYKAEASILKEFSKFFLNGSLYRGSKPVMWSPVEKTALAEAEIEYKDVLSKSIYVAFPIIESKFEELKNSNVIIWTTTPWTIPGNQAIAFGKEIVYALIDIKFLKDNKDYKKKLLISKNLYEQVFSFCDIKNFSILKEFKGKDLEGTMALHPLNKKGYEQHIPLLNGEFVDESEGTGFVHIAPSYGEDDFYLAKSHNLEIKDIVSDNGIYKENTPLFAGLHIFKADIEVIKSLDSQNNLMGVREYTHSYPHSWRSKKPVIYRTTPQWFISMEKDNLRKKAIEGIENTKWIPGSSKNRIKKMVTDRPDWCVSRQRAWGVPLTIFVNKKTGEPLRDKNIMEKIILEVEKNGSDVWLSSDASKFLGSDKDPADYEIIRDILDVWFDSGSTHAFVLEGQLKWPADLYLEGTDQHRGFFQSSLLESCGTRGVPPYKSVLTHGFVLDGKGRKMSKSLGNVVKPEDILKKSGADILRLWVATTDYTEDMRIGDEILSNLNDYYRKIRNSFRFILGNIGDTNLKDCIDYENLTEIDKYILAKLINLNELRINALNDHTYHTFYKTLFEFCSVDLSSFYFDISKDTLYCNSKKSKERKSIVTVLFYLYDYLTTWFAPVLSHTTEEAWREFRTEKVDSVHLKLSSNPPEIWKQDKIIDKWVEVKKIRKYVNTALENVRNQKLIGSSMEAEVYIYIGDKNLNSTLNDIEMKKILIVSSFVLLNSIDEEVQGHLYKEKNVEENLVVFIKKTSHLKCLRCWQYDKNVLKDEGLCLRCKMTLEQHE